MQKFKNFFSKDKDNRFHHKKCQNERVDVSHVLERNGKSSCENQLWLWNEWIFPKEVIGYI